MKKRIVGSEWSALLCVRKYRVPINGFFLEMHCKDYTIYVLRTILFIKDEEKPRVLKKFMRCVLHSSINFFIL